MASTSIAAARPERESTNTSQVISTSPSLCSSCFEWVSSCVPWRFVQSDSKPSAPTAGLIPDNEAYTSIAAGQPEMESTSRPSTSTAGLMLDNNASTSIAAGRSEREPTSRASISDSGSQGTFHGIAPPASTSASKRTQKPSYHVFINHRGPDVKHTLAISLYAMLNAMSLSVFLDSQELEYGDFLPRTIEAAMDSALLHIAIFSKKYAESPWCLAELSFMLKSGAKIIPIFYHVEPSDLKWVHQGKGTYAQAFKDHERKGRYSPEQLQEWKSALHKVSFYNGQIIKNKEDEMRLLKNIVSCVLKEIYGSVPLKVAKHPVGMKEIVEDFKANTLRSAHGNQYVQIVGIWGMGGSGKTTLAKELYDEISSSMERSSFVFNVRDAATKGLLHEKQRELLEDLGVSLKFGSVEKGMGILSMRLRSVRVLIVLDDVDNMEQLDALLPTIDGLEKGSLIIVTTRVRDILECWGISSIYKMRQLDPLYAKQLFCWHAFLQSYPPDGFKELVEQFLKKCDGLPLSLKVFGAQLYGESRKEYWLSQLGKISKILDEDIKQKLKISYDTLDDEEKEMFLDSACFFIGQKSSLAIEVWNGRGWSALRSWERLLHRCLVELDDENNCIRMHDHLRDLGRDIANKQSPYRLWFPQQILDVQNQIRKRVGIQGIIQTSNQILWTKYACQLGEPSMIKKIGEVDEFSVCVDDGKLMVNTNGGIWSLAPSFVGLKYLVLSGDSFNQVMGNVSRELVWLRWFQIGQRNLPSGLPLRKLRVLELYEESMEDHHLEELWGETDGDIPVQLRQLIISDCFKFQGFPKSIGNLIDLKQIIIIYSFSITSLPDEFCLIQSLEHLVLSGCDRLSSLPSNFGDLSNLRHLCLNGSKLKRLPVTFKNLKLLEHLDLRCCSELTFMLEDLNFLENIRKLEYLNLSECTKLEELPRHITNQASLRDLNFSNTSLRKLPDNIGQLSRLTRLRISHLSTSLPTSVGDLSSLMNLEIMECGELKCLPDSLGNLSSLTNLKIRECGELKCLSDSLGNLSSLMNLEIRKCGELKCLPDSYGNLSSLTNLEIEECGELKCLPDSLGNLSSLTNLTIRNCGELKCLPDSLGNLSSLTNLTISNCGELKCLPDSLGNLSSLTILTLGNLSSLTILNLTYLVLECLPDSFRNLSSLTDLTVYRNPHLKEIEALPRTLELICLEDCEMLENIPSFAELTSLRAFYLSNCYGIEKIEGLENCTRLEKLTANTCWEVPGIESLEHMRNLKRLQLKANNGSVIGRCIQSIKKWPDDIMICARAVPDAASLLQSLLSPDLIIVDSISNRDIFGPELVVNSISDGDAIMLCWVINCVPSQMRLDEWISSFMPTDKSVTVEKGRWVWVWVPESPHESSRIYSRWDKSGGIVEECGEVERGFAVRGAKQTVKEAFRSLVPLLLQS